MAEDRGEQPVGIGWIDSHRRYLLTVAQAEVRPCFARIGRAIDAVADRKVGPVQPFATGNVDHIAVRGRHHDRANRLRILPIENRIPCTSVIGRLPHPAIYLADVEHVRLVGNTRRGTRAASAKWPDHAPVHIRHGTSLFRNQASDRN